MKKNTKIGIIIMIVILLGIFGAIWYFGRNTDIEISEAQLIKILVKEVSDLRASSTLLYQQNLLIQNYLYFENPEMVGRFNESIKQK